jgi:hypothetical protein
MTEQKRYGIIEETQEQPKFPVRTLLRVPHQDLAEGLVVSREVFGANTLRGNITEMAKNYCYPNTREVISFREPTTSESISAAAFDFNKMAKLEIFNTTWLQAGFIVRTSEGVYATTKITDEAKLKGLRDKAKKVNGIWILENGQVEGVQDFGFAPYESFTRGVQDCDTFEKGGLARVLEHTEEKIARKLRAIASPKNYNKGVNVCYFDATDEPTLRVAFLSSGFVGGGRRLRVFGDSWCGDSFAFGVLDKTGVEGK